MSEDNGTCESDARHASNPPPDICVDRGQPVMVTVLFGDGDPDEVYFSYTRPGEERPYTDDGYGQPKSRIIRMGPGCYRYVIATKGFKSGPATWHCSGEWHNPLADGHEEASIFGAYHVNPAPEQLL